MTARAAAAPSLACQGCGGRFDAAEVLAFRCPGARSGDDVDHVLVPRVPPAGEPFPRAGEPNPFLRYRRLTLAWHLARARGLADADFAALVRALDDAVAAADGRGEAGGFRETPFRFVPALGVHVKDETGNVSGSHKARHLFGVMVYLRVLEEVGLLGGRALRARRLAIASCGNAALAAAVVARAAAWPLDVFVPEDAGEAVLARLAALGAAVRVCPRRAGEAGDPTVRAFLAAVEGGSLPFGVQGPHCGLAVEGGRTLAWELASAGVPLDAVLVQVGGGALASAVWQGLRDAAAAGALAALPRLYAVQTEGCWPLRRAWERLRADGVTAAQAARRRGRYMAPWPETPRSVAHGILDDETYDWVSVCEGLAVTGGDALVVGEAELRDANRRAREATGVAVSFTGSAGLAGLAAARLAPGARAAVLLTGIAR